MSSNTIVTIGRQYGSGGRYVARLLSEKLGIPYYDKELLAEVSKDSGICEDLLAEHDEKNSRSFLLSLMSGTQPFADSGAMYMDMPLNHRIFLAQFDTIRRIASQGPCIFVGRCADYVLRDEAGVFNVFIKASKENRIQRIIKLYNVDPLKAEEMIKKAVDSALNKAGLNPNHFDSEDHIQSNIAKGWITPEQAEQGRPPFADPDEAEE